MASESQIVCKKLYICNRKNNLIRVDDKFYTEDTVLVHVLYVSNIPAEVDFDTVKAYFETFGVVEDVIYKRKYKTSLMENRATAIVKFKEPQSASKALRSRIHKIGNVRLIVRGGDSWIQPHKIRIQPIIKVDDNDIESFMILKLNHDCILNLFRYLKYNDHVRLSLISDRMKKIFIEYYCNKKEIILNADVLDSLSLMDVKDSFILIGKRIERLFVNCKIDRFYRIYDFILKFFSNLKHLYMEDLPDQVCTESNKEISIFFKKLTHLTLKNCCVNDKHVRKLNKLRHLEYLDLSLNPKLEGKYIHNFPNLKSLQIQNCNSIELPNLKNLICAVPLKFLNVLGIEQFDNNVVLTQMVQKVKSLEEFHVSAFGSNNENLKIIPRMENLKKIRLSFSKLEPNDTGLKQFLISCLENKRNTLEYLGLITSNLQLTNENIQSICKLTNLRKLELIRINEADCMFWTNLNNLKELRTLKFSYALNDFDESAFISWLKKAQNIQTIDATFMFYKIKIDFVHQLIDTLTELCTNKQKVHIDMFGVLYETEATVNILTDVKCLANRSLITVNLKSSEDIHNLDANLIFQPSTVPNLLQAIHLLQNNIINVEEHLAAVQQNIAVQQDMRVIEGLVDDTDDTEEDYEESDF